MPVSHGPTRTRQETTFALPPDIYGVRPAKLWTQADRPRGATSANERYVEAHVPPDGSLDPLGRTLTDDQQIPGALVVRPGGAITGARER